MNKSLKKIILLLFLISLTNLKYCGIVNLFEKKKLTNNSYISITQDLQEKNNGSALTIFGWLKISKQNLEYHPLLKFSFLQTNENLQKEPTLKNFGLITYTKKKQEKSFLTFTFAKKKNKWDSKKIFFDLPENTWFFISYGFDYKKKMVQIHISYQIFGQDITLTKNYETDYENFFIKKNFELNLGCFPVSNGVSNLTSEKCLEGESSNFNFSLEYFENPKFLYLLDFNKQKSVNFNFDIYPKKNKEKKIKKIISKNNPFFSLDIIGDMNFGEKSADLSYDNKLVNDSLILKGKTKFVLNNINLTNSEKKVNSPTFYFNFKYKEPLPITLRILKVTNKISKTQIHVYLKKIINSNKRFLDIFIPGTNFRFTTSAIFLPEKIQKFSISLIQEKNLFWIYINHPNEDNYSLKTNLNLLGDSEITFFDNIFLFSGNLKINQINILPSAAGIIYNKIQPRYNHCDQNCDIFSNLNIKNKSCNNCLENFVFEPKNSLCKKFCPFGTKNINNVCNNCIDKKCSELQKQFFKIIKVKNNQFVIEASQNVNLEDRELKTMFKVAVLRAVPNKEYSYKIEFLKEDKTKKSLLYTFDYKKSKNNHKIVFELDPKKKVFSKNKNRIPIHIILFDRFDKDYNPRIENYKYGDYIDMVNKSINQMKKNKIMKHIQFSKNKKAIDNIMKNLKKEKLEDIVNVKKNDFIIPRKFNWNDILKNKNNSGVKKNGLRKKIDWKNILKKIKKKNDLKKDKVLAKKIDWKNILKKLKNKKDLKKNKVLTKNFDLKKFLQKIKKKREFKKKKPFDLKKFLEKIEKKKMRKIMRRINWEKFLKKKQKKNLEVDIKKKRLDLRNIFNKKKEEKKIPSYLKRNNSQQNFIKEKPERLNFTPFTKFINKKPIIKNPQKKNFDLNKILKKNRKAKKLEINKLFVSYYNLLKKKLLIKTEKEKLLKNIITNLQKQKNVQKNNLITKFKKYYIKTHNDNLRKLIKEKILKKIILMNLQAEKKINKNQRLKLKNLFNIYYRNLFLARQKLKEENKGERRKDKILMKNEIKNYLQNKENKKFPILLLKNKNSLLKKNSFKNKLIKTLKKIFLKIYITKLQEKRDLMKNNIGHYNKLLLKNKKRQDKLDNFYKRVNIKNEILRRNLNYEKIKSESLLKANLELKKKISQKKKKIKNKKIKKLVNKYMLDFKKKI